MAEREKVQRELFADPQLGYLEAVQSYQHDVDWSNRLILGDSLTVMNSLAQREDLVGKVQMIYIDPPYGIKIRLKLPAHCLSARCEGQGTRSDPRTGTD